MFKKQPRTWMYPWHESSKGAKAIAAALGIRRIKHEESSFTPGPHKTVINWGASRLPDHVQGCKILNHPDMVTVAANKGMFFDLMSKAGVPIPRYTRSQVEALKWHSSGRKVFARMLLNGHSGEGIVDMSEIPEAEIEDALKAKLFVEYIPKKEEYRVHVFNNRVVDVQQKKLRTHDDNGVKVDPEHVNWSIRSHANGFVFARNDIAPHQSVLDVATKAVNAIGLTWGAADVIWNEHNNQAYVLEVNTAPGLEGTTLEKYISAFKEVI